MKRLLTNKQRAVLVLVAAGKSNSEIADALELSRRTVDAHVRAAIKRLGATDRTSAVVLAMNAGIITMAEAMAVLFPPPDASTPAPPADD